MLRRVRPFLETSVAAAVGFAATARFVALAALVALAAAEAEARADESANTLETEKGPTPPLPQRPLLQYGVAFTIEGVASPGPICAQSTGPCILGSGGGIAVRVGWRPTEHFYIGGAYELSKQEPDKLYRLGILQQARGEGRWFFPTGLTTTPFVLAGAGLAGYGNEWSIDTWGASLTFGAGLEIEVSGGLLLDLSLAYRPIFLQHYVDSSTLSHNAGIAQFVAFEVAIEATDTL
jgi:hypothetical protein